MGRDCASHIDEDTSQIICGFEYRTFKRLLCQQAKNKLVQSLPMPKEANHSKKSCSFK
jgi:hypothetical protein